MPDRIEEYDLWAEDVMTGGLMIETDKAIAALEEQIREKELLKERVEGEIDGLQEAITALRHTTPAPPRRPASEIINSMDRTPKDR